MARFTVSNSAPDYTFWGDIPAPFDPALVTVRTATNFTFGLDPGGNFNGWTMTAIGTGFKFLANPEGVLEPTEGLITSITIRDGSGAAVLTIDTFPAAQRPELIDVYARLFDTGSDSGPNMFDLFTVLSNFNDTIIGSDNGDGIFTGRNIGNDTIDARGGNDFVKADAGSDSINGGDGFDTLTYMESFWDPTAFKGITLDVIAGTVNDSWGGTDSILNFEEYEGSRFRDTMTGGASDERFSGLRGNDLIDGGAGTRDWALYDGDAQFGGRRGIIVDLDDGSGTNGNIQGTIRDGFGNTDTVRNIERVFGTDKADTFVGSDVNNTFVGNAGRDSYDGALGNDRVAFWDNGFRGATAGVVVDLSRASGQIRNDGFGNIETAISIENVTGGNLNDTIRGNAAGNFIEGDAGADMLTGGGGSDGFGYYNINNFGDTITDFTTGVDKIFVTPGDIEGLADTPLSFRVGNSVAATAGTTGAFYFRVADRTLYYDQDGTGTAFAGVAVLTVQVGGSIAAGDLILDV